MNDTRIAAPAVGAVLGGVIGYLMRRRKLDAVIGAILGGGAGLGIDNALESVPHAPVVGPDGIRRYWDPTRNEYRTLEDMNAQPAAAVTDTLETRGGIPVTDAGEKSIGKKTPSWGQKLSPLAGHLAVPVAAVTGSHLNAPAPVADPKAIDALKSEYLKRTGNVVPPHQYISRNMVGLTSGTDAQGQPTFVTVAPFQESHMRPGVYAHELGHSMDRTPGAAWLLRQAARSHIADTGRGLAPAAMIFTSPDSAADPWIAGTGSAMSLPQIIEEIRASNRGNELLSAAKLKGRAGWGIPSYLIAALAPWLAYGAKRYANREQ